MEPVSISRELKLPKGLDYQVLRSEGLALLQRLSGQVWTDYNKHDPGITMLEAICYAITDLSYRAGFDIEEILQASEYDDWAMQRQALFGASSILPGAPLTALDYRILLIDRIPGIRNAWVEPVTEHIQGIRGLWKVMVQADENMNDETGAEMMRSAVYQEMLRNRNLGEDLESVEILKPEFLRVYADVEIRADASTEEVLANIYHQLEMYLSPPVRLYSAEELIAEGVPPEEIYQGPVPLHGFVKPEELQPLPSEIYLSKLSEIVSTVQGVIKVRSLTVERNGFEQDDEILVFESQTYPLLETPFVTIGTRSVPPIRLWRGDFSNEPNLSTAQQIWLALTAKFAKYARTPSLQERPRQPSSIKEEDLAEYISFQNYLPGIYGLNKEGLPGNPPPERQAAVRQLRGYLMLVEQVLANYLAQLANFKRLMSVDNQGGTSFYHQAPSDIPYWEELLSGGSVEKFGQDLANLMKKQDRYDERRNRLLDHLLSRFGVSLAAFPWGTSVNGEEVAKAQTHTKSELLRNFVELSRDRYKGFNYSLPAWENNNLPALKKHVSLMLQIELFANRPLSSGGLPLNIVAKKKDDVIVETIDDPASGNTVRKYFTGEKNEDTSKSFVFAAMTPKVLEDLFYAGSNVRNFKVVELDGKYCVTFKPRESTQPYVVHEAASEADAVEKTQKITQMLKEWNRSSEGFHLLEHVLLRSTSSISYGYHLLNDRDDIVLVSPEFDDMEAIRVMADDLPIAGSNADNYEVLPIGTSFGIVLKNVDGEVIGQSMENYDTEHDALEMINDLADYLSSFLKSATSIYNRLEFVTERKKDTFIHENFYSLHLSVVAPDWPGRFQDTNFRKLFCDVFCEAMPAHLAVDFYWIGRTEMAQFEETYIKWLELKSQSNPDIASLDKLSFELGEKIRAFAKSS